MPPNPIHHQQGGRCATVADGSESRPYLRTDGTVRRHGPILTIALSSVAIATWALPGAAVALQYDRAAIAGGELWRLVTGHWAHWGTDHLTWDLVVFTVFGALIERRSRRGFAAVVGGAAAAISVALWFAAPQFQFYRGLSGIDSALFAAFFAQLLRDAWRERSLLEAIVPVLALLGFVGKSVYELATGATLFVAPSSAFTAVPLAHLVGALVGLLLLVERKETGPIDPIARSVLRPFLVLALVVFAVRSCSSRVVPSVASLVQGGMGFSADRPTARVDISELLPYMQRATWTDRWVFWKTSVGVVMGDGTTIRFERLSPMFRIDGVEGTFLVNEVDQEAYWNLFGRIVLGCAQ